MSLLMLWQLTPVLMVTFYRTVKYEYAMKRCTFSEHLRIQTLSNWSVAWNEEPPHPPLTGVLGSANGRPETDGCSD